MNIKIPVRRLTVVVTLSLFCLMAVAQKTVTGKVVDTSGEPMIGVSVKVKGTQIIVYVT